MSKPGPDEMPRPLAAQSAAIDDFLHGHQIDDPNIRELVALTRQALKLLDAKLADAGLDPHGRANFWQLLVVAGPAA